MKRGIVVLGLVVATACSHGPSQDAGAVLTGVPSASATACSAVPTGLVAKVYGAEVTKTHALSASRATQTRQSGCVVDVQGQRASSLAVYLWHGDGFPAQWSDELAFDGRQGLAEQSYGLEAYGGVTGSLTTLDVRQRHYALRLLCEPAPARPTRPLGVAACARLLAPLDRSFSH